MEDTPLIRFATLDDLPQITNIFLHAVGTYLPELALTPEFSYQTVQANLRPHVLSDTSGVVTTFVAVQRPFGILSGHASVKAVGREIKPQKDVQGRLVPLPPPGPEIDHLFLLLEGSEAGLVIGDALMAHIQAQTEWQKSGLWARHFQRNQRAASFYRKWNFRQVAVQTCRPDEGNDLVCLLRWEGGGQVRCMCAARMDRCLCSRQPHALG